METHVLGLLAHVDAGKTTLTEALLYNKGVLSKMGRVDRQDAYLDTDALEKKRGITIFSKQAVIHEDDRDLILMDTPGHADFSAEMERVLAVLDAAVLIVSAPEGIESHTRTLWKLLSALSIPVFIFVNKMDQITADREKVLTQLKQSLSDSCIDFTDAEGNRSDDFYEDIATCGEELLEEYLEQGEITRDTIAENIKLRFVFPVVFGSALHNKGISELVDIIDNYIRASKPKDEFGARVFKITHDRDGARLTHVRLTGGDLRVRDTITYTHKGGTTDNSITEKITGIRLYSGEGYENLQSADPGSIAVLTGLTSTYAGQGLGAESDFETHSLMPALNYKMELPDGCDPVTVLPMLKDLSEEDPQLHLSWDPLKKEISLGLMGEIQTQIIKSMIQDRFGIEVSFSPGSIIYKETITDAVEGVGHFEPLRHYAEVHLLIEPGEPGSGLVYQSDCHEEVLASNYQKLVLSHLHEREHKGVLTGSVLTDIKITLKSGRSHLKHTEGGDFRQATYRAVRQGIMQAGSVLLEPYYEFTLSVPENYIGRAMTDLDGLKSSFEAPDILDGMAVFSGRGPVSCLQSYGRDVAEYTRGLGSIKFVSGGYGECHNTEEVMAQKAYDPESDLRNPSASVFCSHGAGVLVPWYEVFDHMHLPSIFEDEREDDDYINDVIEAERSRHYKTEDDMFISPDEVDSIISGVSGSNKRSSKRSHSGIPGKSRYSKSRHGKSSSTATRESSRAASGGGLATVRRYNPIVRKPEYLLVDGYNIIFAWPELRDLAESNPDSARGRLLDIMVNYRGIKAHETIVVFDAYRLKGHPEEVIQFHNICVVYTKEAETADAYIEKFAHKNSSRYDITVATSDGLEQIIIRGAGCRLMSATDLLEDVEKSSRDIVESYQSSNERSKIYLGDSMPDDIVLL